MTDDWFRRGSGVHSSGLHVICCPKYRKSVLRGSVAQRLETLLRRIAVRRGWQIVVSEVKPDHVHVFVRVGPTDSASNVARAFKGRTSRGLRTESPTLRRQRVLSSKSYFAASVGNISEATVRRYVEHLWGKVA